ncbi:hypothetical protein [Streptomyces sp. NBC_01483]|uniref:hypothetical protein n=1 Tax=Streptomyces sp. NBC_01483 TaxID=2903883 RepID=UPI002E329C85|nr:hypothetical protein [Streptomyces sp. NBC_01483]
MTSFSDNFNRADSTDLGASWVEVSGDWSIVSNQLSPGAAGGTIILRAAGAMASNDNYAQATIAATTTASQGVWCRGNSNISQGYLWRNNGTSWDLFQVFGGSFTNIGTYTAAAAPGDVAKVQAVGSTIKGFVNGIQRVSVTDTAVTTGTSVGIRSDSAGAVRYDDFAAADVTAGAALGVATAVDAAQPLTGSKAATLGAAAETATAQPLTGAKAVALTPAAEEDAAQGLAGVKASTLGVAGTVGSAQPLIGTKTATLAPVVEQDIAQPLSGTKTGALGIAAAAEAAQPLTGFVTTALGTVTAAETARPLTGSKTATLGTAVEVDTAHPLTTPSTNVPSPERTYRIPAEHRRLTVVAGHRRCSIPAEPRTNTIWR